MIRDDANIAHRSHSRRSPAPSRLTLPVVVSAGLALVGVPAVGVVLHLLGSRHSGAHMIAEAAVLFVVALAAYVAGRFSRRGL